MNGNFVTIIPQLLHMSIVGVFVRQEKSGQNVAAVWIGSIGQKQLLIDIPIFVVNRIVECDDHHLRRFFRSQITRNSSGVRTAEAVRQRAIGQITAIRRIWIVFRVTPRFVRLIGTID